MRLIKYNPTNIKHNRMTQRKKAEYVGWMHRSRLILSPSSITDVQSGLHDKLLTAITDTTAIMQSATYFTTADSLNAELVNNYDWMKNFTFLDFARDLVR